jgi:hypothetical protein
MLEKEAYGKLKKMCNTMEDIRGLLIILVETTAFNINNQLTDDVYFPAIEQLEKIKNKKK